MDKFNELRSKYPEFIYDSYTINDDENNINIIYKFEIPSLCIFNPQIIINKSTIKNNNIDKKLLDYIVFHIGLIEMISYFKCTCSPNIIIKCGYLDESQINWLKDLMYNGLGELLYKNDITTTKEDLVNIKTTVNEKPTFNTNYVGKGNLIPVGGGKDSCVTLEILKNEKENSCFIINPKDPSLLCAKAAGYDDENIIKLTRILDRQIVDLNSKGFINGHTPFSAIVAMTSYLCAYLLGKENIVLSNESSANEETVIGTNVNHQFSKSYEFEKSFDSYVKETFKINLNYFSLLRGLSEYQIGMIFSKYDKYHEVFKSCNLGSKELTWKWCLNCPKCLFVFIILSPHLYKEKLINIFGEDLFERKDMLDTFLEIIGETEVKPFECVGTINEAKYAISTLINKLDKEDLPYLLKYYYENFELYLNEDNILGYNTENSLNEYYNKLVQEELNSD